MADSSAKVLKLDWFNFKLTPGGFLRRLSAEKTPELCRCHHHSFKILVIILIILTRPKPARPSRRLTSRLWRSARKFFLSRRGLEVGSDDFSWQTDRQTLHHNIFISSSPSPWSELCTRCASPDSHLKSTGKSWLLSSTSRHHCHPCQYCHPCPSCFICHQCPPFHHCHRSPPTHQHCHPSPYHCLQPPSCQFCHPCRRPPCSHCTFLVLDLLVIIVDPVCVFLMKYMETVAFYWIKTEEGGIYSRSNQ